MDSQKYYGGKPESPPTLNTPNHSQPKQMKQSQSSPDVQNNM